MNSSVHNEIYHHHHGHHEAQSTSLPSEHSKGNVHFGESLAHSMKMHFHGGYNEVILFDFWSPSTLSGFILSVLVIVILSTIYEGIKLLREYLLQREIVRNCAIARTISQLVQSFFQFSESLAPERNPVNACSAIDHSKCEDCIVEPVPRRCRCSRQSMNASSMRSLRFCRIAHFVQTLFHLLQITLSYFLMLIAMTYNTYLFLAVIIGSTLGYFLFAWKRTTILDCSEHCH